MNLSNESHVVRKERCPECAKLGNDKSGDNLAIYSDGHSYCYSCGYLVGRGARLPAQEETSRSSTVCLPTDVTTELPYEAKAWLQQYELTQLDIKKHLCMWSDSWSRLIFPYFVDGDLLAWQGRYIQTGEPTEISKKQAKWYSQGKIHAMLHPVEVHDRQAVIVEDIVSAIKVSKIRGAIPLFGCKLSSAHLKGLKLLCNEVCVWLDPDKRQDSMKISRILNLIGLNVHVIFSEKDPKEHSYNEIHQLLTT